MKTTCFVFLFISSFTIACDQNPKKNYILKAWQIYSQHTQDVSVINLIATPGNYNGRKVRLIGYLHIEFEGDNLYLHKDDYDNGISKNAVWVDITGLTKDSLKNYSDHYVILEGTFDSQMDGHMGMNSGSIKSITRLNLWEPAK